MRRVEVEKRGSAAVPFPCTRNPPGEIDVAQVKVVMTERYSEMLRGKEMTQPTSHGSSDVETKTSLPMPGGSEIQTGGRGGEKQGQTVVPFSDISIPPEGGDVIGTVRASQKRCSEFVRGGGSSPPNDLATIAKGNGALSTEIEGEVETPKEAEMMEVEETKGDEEKEGEESETCSSFGVEPTARRVQKETEPPHVTEAAVDQKSIEEGVLKMLTETD